MARSVVFLKAAAKTVSTKVAHADTDTSDLIQYQLKVFVRQNNFEALKAYLTHPTVKQHPKACYGALALALTQAPLHKDIITALRAIPGVRAYEATPTHRIIILTGAIITALLATLTQSAFFASGAFLPRLLMFSALAASGALMLTIPFSILSVPLRSLIQMGINRYFTHCTAPYIHKLDNNIPLTAKETQVMQQSRPGAHDATAYRASFIPSRKNLPAWCNYKASRTAIELEIQNDAPRLAKLGQP